MHPFGKPPPVGQIAIGGRVGHEHAEAGMLLEQRVNVADDQIDAERLRPCGKHLKRLRMAPPVDKKRFLLRLGDAMGKRHGLSGSGRLIEHRGVGDAHPRQVADHRLKGDDRLHPALADLGLVGRVGGVPGGVFQDVALDHRGRVAGVIALADETLQKRVAGGNRPQFFEGRRF